MRRVVWILLVVVSGCAAHKSYDLAPSSSHEFSAKMANHHYGRFVSIHNQKLVPQTKSYVDAAAAYSREFGKFAPDLRRSRPGSFRRRRPGCSQDETRERSRQTHRPHGKRPGPFGKTPKTRQGAALSRRL